MFSVFSRIFINTYLPDTFSRRNFYNFIIIVILSFIVHK